MLLPPHDKGSPAYFFSSSVVVSFDVVRLLVLVIFFSFSPPDIRPVLPPILFSSTRIRFLCPLKFGPTSQLFFRGFFCLPQNALFCRRRVEIRLSSIRLSVLKNLFSLVSSVFPAFLESFFLVRLSPLFVLNFSFLPRKG